MRRVLVVVKEGFDQFEQELQPSLFIRSMTLVSSIWIMMSSMRSTTYSMRKRAFHLTGAHTCMWIILMILCIMMT